MPWVDVCSKEDWASLWYSTNSRNGWTTGFDPAKPTVVLIHPPYMDSSWMRYQLEDDFLNSKCNMIAYDMRCAGRTRYIPNGKHDLWTDAADLAVLLLRLRITPVHIFASEAIASHCALRFAALFPHMVLSLTMVLGASGRPQLLQNVFNGWNFADDVAALGVVARDWYVGIFGDSDTELMETCIDYWLTLWPPTRRVRAAELYSVMIDVQDHMAPTAVLEAVTCPVLIIQGRDTSTDANNTSETLVEQFIDSLPNVEGTVRVYPVNSSIGYLSIIQPAIVNKTFAKFLSALGHTPLEKTPYEPYEDTMRRALERLASLFNMAPKAKADFLERNAAAPMSFSMTGPEAAHKKTIKIHKSAKDQEQAPNPLGPDGRPVRKFSDRFQNLWHSGSIDASGMSVAGAGPRAVSNPTSYPSPAHMRSLPEPAHYEKSPRTRGTDVNDRDRDMRVARTRRGTLADNVPIEKAAAVVGTMKRMATQTAVNVGSYL